MENIKKIQLLFVGDICFGKDVKRILHDKGIDYLFENVKQILLEADVSIANLECCIVDTEWEGEESMAVPSNLCNGLNKCGFDIFNLANNHILDCGKETMIYTQNYLNDMNMKHYGAGINVEEAVKPLIVKCKGYNIGFLGVTDASKYYASINGPGVASLDKRKLLQQVKKLKKEVDFVVVSLHADLEFVSYPAPWRISLSRSLIVSGALLVVQHHPHVIQGIEEYEGGLIAYSLGNFIFQIHGHKYMEQRPETAKSFILKVTIEAEKNKPKIKWESIPIRIDDDHRPYILSNIDSKHQNKYINSLSLNINDKNYIRLQWKTRCKLEAKITIYSLIRTIKQDGWLKAIKDVFNILCIKEERRWIYGFLTNGYK